MTPTTRAKGKGPKDEAQPDALAAYRIDRTERQAVFTYGGKEHRLTYVPVCYADMQQAKRDYLGKMPKREGPGIDKDAYANAIDDAANLAALRAILTIDGQEVALEDLQTGLAPGFIASALAPVVRAMMPETDLGN